MAKVVQEIVDAPGGTIWVAPVGTPAPANDASVLDAAWVDAGYATPDGVTFRRTFTEKVRRAWQSQYPLGSKVTSREASIAFVLEQWNKITFPLAQGGGSVTQLSAGHYKFTPPAAGAGADERAMIVEWLEDFTYRLVVPKLSLAPEQVETQLNRDNDALLPLSFGFRGSDVADPWYMLTNDPAFNPA